MRTLGERPVILDELYSILARAERLVVRDSPSEDAEILFESTVRTDVDDLQRHLLLEVPTESLHCMCVGSPALSLYAHGTELVRLTNHHGLSVRCSLWTSDVPVRDTEKWLSWFDRRGVPGPRQEVEEMRGRQEGSKRRWEKWLASMPKAIVPVWSKALRPFGTVDVAPLRSALEENMSNERERILVLLEWFGAGAGPWSAVPAYETAAEELLLDYSTQSIASALLSSIVSAAQTEGAARLFAGWWFRKRRPCGEEEIPEALKRILWEHVKSTKDKGNLRRASLVFGGSIELEHVRAGLEPDERTIAARAEAMYREYGLPQAIAILEAGIRELPDARSLREKLFDVLLEAGESDRCVVQMIAFAHHLVAASDEEAAARVLDEVLLLEPANAEAAAMLRNMGYSVPDRHTAEESEDAPDPFE